MNFLIFLIFGIYFLLIIFYLLFFINVLLMAGHDLPTSRQAIKSILKIVATKKENKNNFYDLGCGRGDVLIPIKKAFPQFSVIGIEKRPLQIFFGKLKAFFSGQKVIFKKADLFDVNLSQADIVYTYLSWDLMPEIERKLKRELKPGAIVITNTSCLPNWQPEETHIVHPKKSDFEKLFVYINSKTN